MSPVGFTIVFVLVFLSLFGLFHLFDLAKQAKAKFREGHETFNKHNAALNELADVLEYHGVSNEGVVDALRIYAKSHGGRVTVEQENFRVTVTVYLEYTKYEIELGSTVPTVS